MDRPAPYAASRGPGFRVAPQYPRPARLVSRCRGLRERSAWEYVRFHVVQTVQPWCGRTAREVPAIFGRVHEIGLAHLAQFADTSEVYAGMQWGSLWGRGVRLAVRGDRIVEVKLLWVS